MALAPGGRATWLLDAGGEVGRTTSAWLSDIGPYRYTITHHIDVGPEVGVELVYCNSPRRNHQWDLATPFIGVSAIACLRHSAPDVIGVFQPDSII